MRILRNALKKPKKIIMEKPANGTLDELDAIDELLDSCLADIYGESAALAESDNVNDFSAEAKSELSDGTKVGPSLVLHGDCEDFRQPEGAVKWDGDVVRLFKEKFPNKDIYNMSLEDLRHLRDDVEALREEFSLIELAYKVLSNGAYGASANAKGFYFYNLAVAGDITGECRALTKYFWTHLEEFFHETIWERKDLWEKFGFELDGEKRELCRSLPVSCYSDTDSVSASSFIYIKENERERKITMSEFESLLKGKYKCAGHENENGQIMYAVPGGISVLNVKLCNENNKYGLVWDKIRYLMCHEVNKPLYTFETESGKSVTVTGDHSLMVKRGNETAKTAAAHVNKETDKLITVRKR